MQPQSATQRKKIGLEDFDVKRIIGKGSYGDVFLVQKDGTFYAMKQIIKRKLHREKKEYQAMVERELLRCMKHPGIIKLRYAFQDKNKLYFVMQYCENGEFVRFMKEYVESFNEDVRRFYVAQIINLLQYLHSNGITHRDIKPQNLLLTKEGHLKLIDFGTSEISECSIVSKQFKEQIERQKQTQQKSYEEDVVLQQPQTPELQQMMSPRKRRSTFVGTSYYISPELLEENVCEPPSDLWALGCIVYQLYYLETPFKDTTEYGVFEKIKKVQLEFPKNDLISKDATDLIQKLLIKNPSERLGSCSREQLDFKHLKSHPYFNGMDIDKIYSTVPPDVPTKRFSLVNGQPSSQQLKAFEEQARKLIMQETKEIGEILVEGVLEKRSFPYYDYGFMQITTTNKARYIMTNRPQNIEHFQLYSGLTKGDAQKNLVQIEVAKVVEKDKGKFYIYTKDRTKEVFKSKDWERWVKSINQLKQRKETQTQKLSANQ